MPRVQAYPILTAPGGVRSVICNQGCRNAGSWREIDGEPMKVVITGSSGLVGTALTESLVRDGHTVVRLLRTGAKKEDSKSGGEQQQKENGSSGQKNDGGRIVNVAWNPNTCDLEGEPFGTEQEKIEGADAAVNLAGASSVGGRWGKESQGVFGLSPVGLPA